MSRKYEKYMKLSTDPENLSGLTYKRHSGKLKKLIYIQKNTEEISAYIKALQRLEEIETNTNSSSKKLEQINNILESVAPHLLIVKEEEKSLFTLDSTKVKKLLANGKNYLNVKIDALFENLKADNSRLENLVNSYETIKEIDFKDEANFYQQISNGDIKGATATFRLMEEEQNNEIKKLKEEEEKLRSEIAKLKAQLNEKEVSSLIGQIIFSWLQKKFSRNSY